MITINFVSFAGPELDKIQPGDPKHWYLLSLVQQALFYNFNSTPAPDDRWPAHTMTLVPRNDLFGTGAGNKTHCKQFFTIQRMGDSPFTQREVDSVMWVLPSGCEGQLKGEGVTVMEKGSVSYPSPHD